MSLINSRLWRTPPLTSGGFQLPLADPLLPTHSRRAAKAVRALCQAAGITDVICAKKRPRGQANHTKLPTPLGMRWTVERTNSWLSNYGQLRRNTDRRIQHRPAQISLAIALIITVKHS